MINVITSFSRITILSFVLIFTLIDIIQIFEQKLDVTFASVLSIIQSVMMMFFFFNASLVLFLSKEDITVWILFASASVIFIVFTLLVRALEDNREIPSAGLLNNVYFFISLGMIFLERLKINLAVKQCTSLVFALVLATGFILIIKRVNHIERFLGFFAVFGIVLLILVKFNGQVENGAKLSMTIGNLRFQPSEFVKISFVFFIAGCIVAFKDYRGLIIATIGSAIHVLILVFSRDLGMAFIFLLTYVFVVFIAYKNYILLILEVVVATVGGILAYNMFPHIQTRFIAWTDPLSVIDDKGYQISQSLFAIAAGGWFGTGINKGMPTKIPVVTMDFIFAAIAEELGGIVAISIIICFICTAFMIFAVAYNCNNSFYMLVSSGFAIIIAVQTILNIGGVIKFIPSTGVTLPFVSYGSNSLVSMTGFIFIICCSNSLYLSKGHSRGRHDG